MTNGNPPCPKCTDCIAKPFCKRYAGELSSTGDYCASWDRLYAALKLSEIPRRYITANIHNCNTSVFIDSAEKCIESVIPNIVKYVEEDRVSFCITGSNTGNGKTFLACMLLNHYIYKKCVTSDFDFEHPLSLFIDYSSLMDRLRLKYGKSDEADLLDLVQNTPLVLLDDVGAGTFSDYVREQTYLIINHRYCSGLPTIITSNYSTEQLAASDKMGNRTITRLLDGGREVKLTNLSMRKERGKR
jgi:DNA replication protein DnaC